MPNSEYFIKTCPLNKIEKECHYRSIEPFGPKTESDCYLYENNPKCDFLVGSGSSFGGSQKYCCISGFEEFESKNPYHPLMSFYVYILKPLFLMIIFTLLIELPIFFIFGFRDKKSLFSIILANLISVIAFYVVGFFLLHGIIFILLAELLIIIFETIFLRLILKEFKIRKIILATLVANIASATIGGYLLILFSSLARWILL